MIRFTTFTGSTYEIDTKAKTWARTSTTERSGRIYIESGPFSSHSEIVVGRCVYVERPGPRLRTSHVVSIESNES